MACRLPWSRPYRSQERRRDSITRASTRKRVRKLYVWDEHGDTDTVIDTTSNKRIATIALGGNVGNTQYDARSRRVYVNVQTTGELVAIDATKLHARYRCAVDAQS